MRIFPFEPASTCVNMGAEGCGCCAERVPRGRCSTAPSRPPRGVVHLSRRIAFINEKGGSAKTTLVANLAAHLALHRGRRVLALDMDPQGQLARALGTDLGPGGPIAVDLLLDEALDHERRRPDNGRGGFARVA